VVKKLLIAAVALGCLGLVGFGVLAWEPAIAPIAPPAAGSFAPELVAKGKHLFAFADHAAEFYAGSGNDCRRALELTRANVANRPTRRAIG
jgi:hypothetical protein